MKPATRDALGLFALALAVRLAVVVWAAPRFPPAADGHYYDVLATRLASGLGYTWQWPDGVVTHAAHYPVGYPALLAVAYAAAWPSTWAAMSLNALVGAAAAPAAAALASRSASRRGALIAGLLVALHPGLLFYTPALMTEGVSAALIVIAAWVSSRPSLVRALPLGALIGVCSLIRPQALLLAPLFGLALATRAKKRVIASACATLVALLVCAPWTLRNCARMDGCAFVSANGGWNLLIGATPSARGTFAPVADEIVPAECRNVFGEVAKDTCFGRAAVASAREAPGAWLALAPEKLYHTFDTAGGAAWYLNAASPEAFGERAKRWLTSVELVFQRLVVLSALAALALLAGPRRRARVVVGGACALLLLTPLSWVSHLGLVVQAALLGRRLLDHVPALAAAATVATTALTHVVFFGAGRYAIVGYAVLAALAGCALGRRDRF